MQQKGFVNFAFALFAALMLVGSAFATGSMALTAWAEPDVQGVSYGLYAKVLDNGQAPPASTISVRADVVTPQGQGMAGAMGLVGQSSQYANQGVYGWGFGNTMPCGTYNYKISANYINGSDETYQSGSFVLSTPYCPQQATNQPPVITSVSGPTSVTASSTQTSNWMISAYDPEGRQVTYSVNWGDGSGASAYSSATTYAHAYSSAGTYTITFTAKDPQGASAQSSITVAVTGSSANQPPVIDSSISANNPTQVNAGDSRTYAFGAWDPENSQISFMVYWGDGSSTGWTTGASVTPGNPTKMVIDAHTYSQAGTYTMTYIVKDAQGATAQSTLAVNVVGASAALPDYQATAIASTGINGFYNGQQALYIKPNTQMPVSAIVKNSGASASGQTAVSFSFFGKASQVTVPALAAGQETTVSAYMYCTSSDSASSLSANVNPDHTLQESNYNNNQLVATPIIVCNQSIISANLAPVITSVGGPAEISIGTAGTWKISAYDPDGTYLSYSALWGDEGVAPLYKDSSGSAATMQHTYYKAGAYKIIFTVTDSAGASTKSTLTVKVKNDATNIGDVSASVGAIPTELYQYDSVYVTGKVSRGTSASDDIQNYVVVLTLDNGNSVNAETKAASPSGSIASMQGTSSSTSVSAVPSQGKEETITLAPGESREVSAYFTASQLGTNFAKIMVYQKSGSTQSGYILVASDSVKVQVKQGGIPSPPNEGVTIVLQKGWNQISVPTFSLEVSTLAEKCDISTNVWYYNAASKQYEKATTLGGGHTGFWVKANSECKYTLETPYITPAPYAFNLKAGWNMIGAPLQATSVNSFAGNCKITSGPWNYAPSASQYTYSEKLETGKGYWVKVASDCIMGSDTGDMPPSAPTESAQTVQATAPQATAVPQATSAATSVKNEQAMEPAQTVQQAQPVHANSAD